MINSHRRWLYSKTVEPKIYNAGEKLKGVLYDSPDFDDPRTKCVTSGLVHAGPAPEPVEIPSAVGEPETTSLVKKYPSQMNKDELIKFGENIGLEFDESMTKRHMVNAIHEALKEADDGEKE